MLKVGDRIQKLERELLGLHFIIQIPFISCSVIMCEIHNKVSWTLTFIIKF